MSFHNIETHRRSQRDADLPALDRWSRCQGATLRDRLLRESIYCWGIGLLLTYGVPVGMWFRRAWNAPPERYLIRNAERLKRKLAQLSFCEVWFEVEGVGTVIPRIDDDWSDERLEDDLRESKLTLALLDSFPKPEDWRELDHREIVKRRRAGIVSYWIRAKVTPSMDRSALIWRLACYCAEYNFTVPEIMASLAASNLWKSKYGRRRRAEEDLRVHAHKASNWVKAKRLKKARRKDDRR